jgi:hypothetical protein
MNETKPLEQGPPPLGEIKTDASDISTNSKITMLLGAIKLLCSSSFVRTFGVAFALWLVLQVPGADRTFLWEPDRQMLDAAFKLRQGVAELPAPPVLWIDVGDHASDEETESGQALPVVVPRTAVATSLHWVRRGRPSVVIVDVDLAFEDHNFAGNNELKQELAAWASDPGSPQLLLVREPLPRKGQMYIPTTSVDEIVERAQKIEWASANLCKDERAQVRSIPKPLLIEGTKEDLISVVDLTSAALGRKPIIPHGSVSPCDKPDFLAHERLIDWHIGPRADGRPLAGMPTSDADLSQNPKVSRNWPGIYDCRLTTPPYAFSRQGVGPILKAADIADTSRLCGTVVIIGADSPLFPDNSWTPLGNMSGPMILANAIRGDHVRSITNTSPRSIQALTFQLVSLFVFVLIIVFVFRVLGEWRASILDKIDQKTNPFGLRLLIFATSPILVKFIIAILAFIGGVAVTSIGLIFGLWGALSAPTYLAALREAGLIIRREAQS